MNWVSLGSLDDLWEGDTQGVDVAGHHVLLVRLDGGEVVAYQGICPHQDQRLADGFVEGTTLTCPGHLWQFDLTNGAGVNPTGCALVRYPLDTVDGEVLISTEGVTPAFSF